MLGTLADDLSCPVQPPSLVLYSTVQYSTVQYSTLNPIRVRVHGGTRCLAKNSACQTCLVLQYSKRVFLAHS